ncbi:MAG: ribokinase [Woeseiaceae bacterium]|tara:strand:- start:1116 stop:2045 length:930 start_codon:yes stop_codon:yes gene_type:complete
MSFKQNPIYIIGSINTDMVAMTKNLPAPGETVMGGEFMMTAGGKGANQAVSAARLGGEVTMVGRLGEDIFGDQSIERLKHENINCDFIGRDSIAASGVALISVDDKGENHIVVAPGANNQLDKTKVKTALDSMPDNAIILLQLEIPLETVAHIIETTRGSSRRVILDPAPAPSTALPDNFLNGLYLITPNETEATKLSGIEVQDDRSAEAAARKLLATGVNNVAITMGAKGVVLVQQNGVKFIKSPKVTAIDSTAAGDCFNGALAVSIANDLSLEQSVERACRAASISVTRKGAQDSMPSKSEVDACSS